MNKLALVTVTYNAERNLSFFLPSLEHNKECIDGVFVVDNASSDNSLSTLYAWKEEHSDIPITIHAHKKNYGYAHAVNQGIQEAYKAGYEYILVTNNDIIFNRGAFAQMMEDLTASHADVVGVPASINTTDVGLGYTLNRQTHLPIHTISIHRKDIAVLCTRTPLPQVDFVHGGTILFTRRFFDEIGFYDDTLFFGGDELDFLYRVYIYNETHIKKILCVVSLKSFITMDNLTQHNTQHKITKAKRILQGTAHVYLKHRFQPTDIGLYKEQMMLITSLAKKSLLRYVLLFAFSLRALMLEIIYYYAHK